MIYMQNFLFQIDDKCQWECKELIDKGVCDREYFGTLVIVTVNVINHMWCWRIFRL